VVFHVAAGHYPSPCTAWGRVAFSVAVRGGQSHFRSGENWDSPLAKMGTVPMLPSAKGRGFARSVLRETVGRWKVCWPFSGALTRGYRLLGFLSFLVCVPYASGSVPMYIMWKARGQ
jgi:hypothetical protein